MSVPLEVQAAWGWEHAELSALSGGLINATYQVRTGAAPIAVLQRLHPVFGPQVNHDLDAVTSHLARHGMITPRLVRTRDGQPWVQHDGQTWRALSWVEGVTLHAVPGPAWAEAGGALVGRYHRAVAGLSHDYAFSRAGVHDTAAHLARLRAHVDAGGDPEAVELGRELLAAADGLPPLPVTPRRHCHGDLKISNLRFSDPPPHGVCLLDLDTLGLGTMAYELGDAMRSWCNPAGEDVARPVFDLTIFAAAIRGLRAVADPVLSRDERRSIVGGLETVCLELAARFAVDVFRDEYFGWDRERFASRRAHNLVRARGQLALGLSVRAVRDDALAVVSGAS